MKYKIWWQSSTVLDPESDYAKSIENHSTKILNPDFELEVHGVNRGTSELHYMFFEFLNIRNVIGNVIKAEEEGYDAVVLGCFTDPGLHEAREVVNIPVIRDGRKLDALCLHVWQKIFHCNLFAPTY